MNGDGEHTSQKALLLSLLVHLVKLGILVLLLLLAAAALADANQHNQQHHTNGSQYSNKNVFAIDYTKC